jgi:hypothetical protein
MRRHSWQLITGSAPWNESEAAHNARVLAGDYRAKDDESGNGDDRDQHHQQAIIAPRSSRRSDPARALIDPTNSSIGIPA